MVDHRLKIAESMGADYTITVQKTDTPENVALEVERILGAMPDQSVDASGQESTIALNMLVSYLRK